MKKLIDEHFKKFNLDNVEIEMVEDILKQKALEVEWSLSEINSKFGSPIERKLYLAILNVKSKKDLDFRIFRQKSFNLNQKKYIADFYIEQDLEAGIKFKLIVECDGHDFHEKTKEQSQRDKERDRNFILAGIHVMRFTGMEIYKNPLKCAEEIYKFFNKKYAESVDLDLKINGW